jgi:sulfite dehydrogenase (quinone) subunit SoeC
MHPAFSVIFFTTLSGMGYGLWFFISYQSLLVGAEQAKQSGAGLLLGFILASGGLLSSTLHLGKPQRAWRAFSQWRTSWLSREGIFAIACFVPATLWMAQHYLQRDVISYSVLAIFLAALSIATVACTAMIYASLKPIPAWQHADVVPVYLLFALLTGGLLGTAIARTNSKESMEFSSLAFMLLALLLGVLKQRYWKDIDTQKLPSRSSALGLSEDKVVTVFEHPHTEANYLTKEMGFVLARKHSKKLRIIAVILFACLPVVFCIAALMLPLVFTAYLMLAATVFAYLGALLERWLFFAEARHAVMQYY